MAKLPVYQNRVSADTGSDTFRVSNDGSSRLADGISALGNGMFNFGLSDAKVAAADQRKVDAYAERNAAYNDQAAMIQYADQVKQFAEDHKNKVGEDAAGYTRAVEEFATTKYKELQSSGRLSRNNMAPNDLLFEQRKSSILNEAMNWEKSANGQFRSKITENNLNFVMPIVSVKGTKGLDEAMELWRSAVANTEGTDTRSGTAVLELGRRRLVTAALAADAAANPAEFEAKFRAAVTGKASGGTGNPLVDATIKYAPQYKLDTATMIAIGKIESGLKADHDGPRLSAGSPRALGRKGATHMSSAEGGWQMLDGVATGAGLSIADKKDPEKSTAAIAKIFAGNQSQLEQLGKNTPGNLYMMYNVGEGVAKRILSADPNTPIEHVIRSSYPSNPAMASQVLRNNPSMYRAGMTVGQVIANYEAKVQNAKNQTKDLATGGTAGQISSAVSEFTGRNDIAVPLEEVTKIYADVSKKLLEKNTEQIQLERGAYLLSNPGKNNPYDPADNKAIDKAIDLKYGNKFLEGIPTGDLAAHTAAQDVTRAVGRIPTKVMHGFKAALDTNNPEIAAKALTTLQQINALSPSYVNASSLDADDLASFKEYRSYTEVLGLDPLSAAKRVTFDRSEEGKTKRRAMAETFKREWNNGGTEAEGNDRAWKEIAGKVSNGSWLSSPDSIQGVQKDLMVESYQKGVQYYRMQGYDLDRAKAMTLHEIDGMWGVSKVSDGSKSQPVTFLAPEKILGPDKQIEGSFDWVKKQAEDHVRLQLINSGRLPDVSTAAKDPRGYGGFRGPDDSATAPAPVPSYTLVPSSGAVANYRAGRPVTYDVYYLDSSGAKQRLPGPAFSPNYSEAKAEADEKFVRENPAKQKTRSDLREDMTQRAMDTF